MKFKTQFNLESFPAPRMESIKTPSMTLPDQAMSMTEILRRHKNGLPISGNSTAFYEETQGEGMTTQEFQRLDLADQEQIIIQRREELEELNLRRIQRENELAERERVKQAKVIADAREAAAKRLAEASGGTQQSTNNP